MNRWNEISDESVTLPSNGRQVLVCHHCNNCHLHKSPFMVWQTNYDHKRGEWYGNQSILGKITHWMEVPESPQD